jgi:hypothetical protein
MIRSYGPYCKPYICAAGIFLGAAPLWESGAAGVSAGGAAFQGKTSVVLYRRQVGPDAVLRSDWANLSTSMVSDEVEELKTVRYYSGHVSRRQEPVDDYGDDYGGRARNSPRYP